MIRLIYSRGRLAALVVLLLAFCGCSGSKDAYVKSKIATGSCNLEEAPRKDFLEWLGHLKKDGIIGNYSLNGPGLSADKSTLYICTEAKTGQWFSAKGGWDARFYPENVIVLKRSFVQAGLIRSYLTDAYSRPGAFLFMLLHEVGHYHTHQFPELNGIQPEAYSQRADDRKDEVFADCWAALHAESIGFVFEHDFEYVSPAYEAKWNFSAALGDIYDQEYEPKLNEKGFWGTQAGRWLDCTLLEPCDTLNTARYEKLLKFFDNVLDRNFKGELGSGKEALLRCVRVRDAQ